MDGKADPGPEVVATAVDSLTTRIAMLEAQVRRLSGELDGARQLYHLVSHEVRTPLTVVLGVLSTLESAELPERERRRLMARALAHAQQLRVVVDELLAGDPLAPRARARPAAPAAGRP